MKPHELEYKVKMSDEEDFRLRDQFAIAAMNALISRVPTTDSMETGTPYLKDDSTCEKLAITAYKIADAMRKARLLAFK